MTMEIDKQRCPQALATVYLKNCLFLSHAALALDQWDYPDREINNASPRWGGLCDTGQAQSPINLSPAGARKVTFSALRFKGYEKDLDSPLLVNNGHTVQMSGFSVPMTLSGGPLKSQYVPEQVHFHWWSEHTIDKVRYPMEAHIVHRKKDYATISEAVEHKDGIAVVGILYHVTTQDNSAIAKITANLDLINAVERIDRQVPFKEKLNLREFFPDLSSGFVTYPGSLTTPSCAESVTWIVLLGTQPVTQKQVNKFKAIKTHKGFPMKNNYREIQKENNRPIVLIREVKISSARLSMSSSSLAMIVSVGVVGLRRTYF